MMLTDPRVAEVLEVAEKAAGRDPIATLELLINLLAMWSSRYKGCAALLGIAVQCLATAQGEAAKFTTEIAP